ncbi:MAG: Rsp5p-dependent ubiquitination, sorting of cargo proteins at the multivesicular body [Chaenotheca gracillima]|nr:MAG: Rsp5p-dependent ubiquitination, sorting of cargo proteins at the multivesicular body [Chaenotheca gracillima]
MRGRRSPLGDDDVLSTFQTSVLQSTPTPSKSSYDVAAFSRQAPISREFVTTNDPMGGSTGKGILIGMLSAFGAAALFAIFFGLIYFFRYTSKGRIILDRIGRPGEYDDEQAFAREEAEAVEEMDDSQRAEYARARAYVQANPPDSMQTDISLSQFLAIQEKGVSAWEFDPELETANCFVEGRTEIEFFDSECSVQSNLPVPKQNDVYYWEAKIYDKPETTLISVGMSTKPYPTFRLPGWHKYSIAYLSTGHRRYNQPFNPTPYGPQFVQGDVVGVGYRPRTGTVFFTRNGKKLDDVAHGLKSQNLFPTIGANGPSNVHVNFGQMGFVFIEANVKKWGLAPMTGSLAPPPPYGSEQGSILLEAGREGAQSSQGAGWLPPGHQRSRSAIARHGPPNSPGPVRSPTDISLAQLTHIPSNEDTGDGVSGRNHEGTEDVAAATYGLGVNDQSQPPPDYTSPEHSSTESTPRSSTDDEHAPMIRTSSPRPPIPSYDAAVANDRPNDTSRD